MPPVRCVLGLVVTAAVLTGCTQTVEGTARLAHTPARSSLDGVLLDAPEINKIMGTSDMEVVESTQALTDTSADVSDTECIGALYHAEEVVYADSGWGDLIDEIVTEPDAYGEHWVEQTAVRFPSREDAETFLAKTKEAWTNCIGKSITIDDHPDEFVWRFEGVSMDGASVSQTARQDDSDGWACRHVMRSAASLIIEVSTCGETFDGEADTIAERSAANAE